MSIDGDVAVSVQQRDQDATRKIQDCRIALTTELLPPAQYYLFSRTGICYAIPRVLSLPFLCKAVSPQSTSQRPVKKATPARQAEFASFCLTYLLHSATLITQPHYTAWLAWLRIAELCVLVHEMRVRCTTKRG
jgi:hypothetical protein